MTRMLHIDLCLPHIKPGITTQLVKVAYSSINKVSILHAKMIFWWGLNGKIVKIINTFDEK